VKVTGMAASIATVIMLGGDTRTMGVGTSIMTHRASTLMMGYYNRKELEEHATGIAAIDNAIVDAYVASTGKSADEINELLDRGEVDMGADEAIEWGFATDKDAKLKAVASADPAQFRQQIEMQGKIRAAEAEAASYKAQVEAQKKSLDELRTELEAFKNPAAATADEVIALCSDAGFDSLAVSMAKEKLPMATVQARLKLAAEVKDIAAAGGLDADVLMQHISNPTQMLRTAITEAKALTDQDLDHHHTPGPGKAKQPDARKAYSQLNNQA
jgi:ribosomal protein L30E